jgi:hypothetical protein
MLQSNREYITQEITNLQINKMASIGRWIIQRLRALSDLPALGSARRSDLILDWRIKKSGAPKGTILDLF